jgi:hypothetical protein
MNTLIGFMFLIFSLFFLILFVFYEIKFISIKNEFLKYLFSLDLFNNREDDIMTVWEGKKGRRMPRRFFLNGCTG